MAARLHRDWMLMWLLGASTFKGFVCRHPPAGPGGQRKRSLGTGGPQTIQEVSGSPWASEICFCALFSTPSICCLKEFVPMRKFIWNSAHMRKTQASNMHAHMHTQIPVKPRNLFQGPEKHSEEPAPRPVGDGSTPRTPAPGLLQVSKGPCGECLGPVSLWLSSKLRAQCLCSG